MSALAVTKLHGALNDFILLDARKTGERDFAALARKICDRHGAIGGDGLLVILPSKIADVRMRIFNADGGEAEMCGNGIRCVARYLHDGGEGEKFTIETIGGIIYTEVLESRNGFQVRVQMDEPKLDRRSLPFANADLVVAGNSHLIIFERDLCALDLAATGERLQSDPAFPEGINVHVAVPVTTHRLDVRHYERGVGLTNACGTGAIAAAVAAIHRGVAASPVDVHVPGGVLRVEWEGSGPAYMTGPAVRVFDTTLSDSADAR
ncbi:MAG: diaminopimelate epimerase [Candidatus Eremiobacteraeota bacterium]|nr:diaminopimelate epimerase [Candidatus Eremiobacteraeota bacterium]